jgi:hypothetical protein
MPTNSQIAFFFANSLLLGAGLSTAAPFQDYLEDHCIDCHDSATAKGDFDMEILSIDMTRDLLSA